MTNTTTKYDNILLENIDQNILEELNYFLRKINDRSLYQKGIIDSYNDDGNPALHLDVEYFHPQIMFDDRMVYIMDYIVCNPDFNLNNRVCNTLISHFYGARGVHQTLTGEPDPNKALIDFEKLALEQHKFKQTGQVGEYTQSFRDRCVENRKAKKPIYGTTELRTSLFGAANKFINNLYFNGERPDRNADFNIAEWIASFLYQPYKKTGTTIIGAIKNSQHLGDTYKVLTSLPGIGGYYGFHGSTSMSVNPDLNFHCKDVFCVPGPGASKTATLLYPKLDTKTVKLGDRIIWFSENQEKLLKGMRFHESTYNKVVNGKQIFPIDQTYLPPYSCEVLHCQFGIYLELKNDPNRAQRRKVARSDEFADLNKQCKI